MTRHANEANEPNDGRRWQPGGPDVRSLLQAAGLLPPKPTERCGKNDGVDGCWRFVDVCCRYNDKQSDAIFFRLKPVKKTILHIIHGAFLFLIYRSHHKRIPRHFCILLGCRRTQLDTLPTPTLCLQQCEPWEVGCFSFWDSGGFEKMRIENWRRLWINSRIMWRTPSSNPMLKPWFLVLLQFVPFGAQAPVHVTKKNPCLNGNYPICHGDRKHLKMLLIPRKRNWYVPSQEHQCLFAQATSLCAWADTNRWLYLICIF